MLNMEPDLAGKITGMLLEMSEGDVIAIIEDKMACQEKVCSTCSFWPVTNPVTVLCVKAGSRSKCLHLCHLYPSVLCQSVCCVGGSAAMYEGTITYSVQCSANTLNLRSLT